MINTEIITVHYSGGEYPIYIGQGLLNQHNLLQRHVSSKQVLLVSNETIAPLYLQTIVEAFPSTQFQRDKILLPDGEQYKSLSYFNKIIDVLAENKHHRDTTLVALGGGVVGDITGFAAACYHRGVNFIQVPTTLLAQVDASIGGKTAVNHLQGKNLIGAFHQPQTVIVDIETLNTLPDREYRAGIAEIIKAALIKNVNFFAWLEKNIDLLLQRDTKTLIHAIKQACQIKSDVVAADEKEKTSERALLNLGHTFGHAIEQNLKYQTYLHGEAVAIGIILATVLSERLGWITQTDYQRVYQLIQRTGLPTSLPIQVNYDKLMQAMLSDKKVLNNQIRLVLLKSLGEAVITSDVSTEQIRSLLQH